MAKKSKTKSTIKEQYMKEYKQFYKRLNRIEARGYTLPDRFRPSIPKKIGTRELERIKAKNNLDYIYDKATFYDIESDRVVSGRKGRELERSRAAKKRKKIWVGGGEPPVYEDAILRAVEEMINNATPTYKNPYGVNMLRNLLFEQIALHGRRYVANRFETGASWVKQSAEQILFSSDQFEIQTNFNAILVLLTDKALSAREMHEYYAFYTDEGWN